MAKLAQVYFKAAVVFLVASMAMGLQMSMSGQHNVVGAHSHMALLGWVSSALFGAYYALHPAKASLRLSLVQFWVYVPAVAVMTVSLYALLLGYRPVQPLLALGGIMAFAGALLFAAVVFRREAQPALATTAANPALRTG